MIHASSSPLSESDPAVKQAAKLIQDASALAIHTGAGMGVDSGLPDFRGDSGFWRAYPMFEKRRLTFYEMASPTRFRQEPRLAWGFYGHRLDLYRNTEPHAGYQRLRAWAASKAGSYFAFTSNVDGHLQTAEFPANNVVECHGSIQRLQCSQPCSAQLWETPILDLCIDPETCQAEGELPRCPECNEVARPNILMFGDAAWIASATEEAYARYSQWITSQRREELVVIELGAGTAVPTVRHTSEQLGVPIIRINPREPQLTGKGVGIPVGALETIQRIDHVLMFE